MATAAPIGFTVIMRLEMPNEAGSFGMLASAIGDAGGIIGAVDMGSVSRSVVVRDVTITVASEATAEAVRRAVEKIEGVKVVFVSDSTFLAHIGGKIQMEPKIPVKTRQDLSMVYTPGVARVSMAIAADPRKAFQLSIKRNTVAVVTDGTAVLGLGDIGPLGALPVMEGKAMLFKQFAAIDAFPICLDTKDVDEIVETVVRIAPVFGGINLEDISAPRCFEIENRLIEALDIPVMHDDQHGTAVVILAALINAAQVVAKAVGRFDDRRRGQRRCRNRDDQDALKGRRSRHHSGRPRGRNQSFRAVRELALALARRTHESGKPPRFTFGSLARHGCFHRRLRPRRFAARGDRDDGA